MVLTTESSLANAEELSAKILKKRLAACISMRMVKSSYIWNGELEKNVEVELLIKSTKDNLEMLLEALLKLHSYETPELIYWPINASNGYKKWLLETCSQ